jgi:hypothetical protein
MDKLEGFKELRRIVIDNVRHRDYARVCDLADEYYKMVSGDGISDLLRRVVSRETEDEFEMRKTITNSIIPPTLASTKLSFQKAVRKKPKVRKIDWETEGDYEKRQAELELKIAEYWGDASLEKFFEYAYVDYNYLDPNAFLITEFDEFDSNKEKAKPYPFIATSQQAIMFEFKNNILQYLVVKLPITLVDEKGKEYEGSKYTIYLGTDTIVFTEVRDKPMFYTLDNDFPEGIEIGGKYYTVSYFIPKSDKIPARRFGFKHDAQTQGRTFISVFHDVMPYLNKTLKIDSELDLSTAMTAFPQRFRYVNPCPDCKGGVTPDGKTCGTCHGTGKEPIHASAMDVVTLNIPYDTAEMIDLDKLLVYKAPPIELLDFQERYIQNLRASIYLMMFNKELMTRNELTNTATEVKITEDNMNDTLKPFASGLSTLWEFVVTDIATFTDLGKGLIVEHQYPDDFKFKTQADMMDELKNAKDAGASTSTIAAIEDDINEMLYADRPEELKIIRIKNAYNPFRGYSEENVRLLISQNLTTHYNAVLWANLESIFNELEQESEVWIYDMADDVISAKVKAKCEEYILQMEETEPKEPELTFTEPIETEDEV